MSGQLGATPRHLRTREILDIQDGQGLRVSCLHGVLWITQSNDTDDIVVRGGQSFVLDRPGLALISAPIGPADIIIQPAVRRSIEQHRATGPSGVMMIGTSRNETDLVHAVIASRATRTQSILLRREAQFQAQLCAKVDCRPAD